MGREEKKRGRKWGGGDASRIYPRVLFRRQGATSPVAGVLVAHSACRLLPGFGAAESSCGQSDRSIEVQSRWVAVRWYQAPGRAFLKAVGVQRYIAGVWEGAPGICQDPRLGIRRGFITVYFYFNSPNLAHGSRCWQSASETQNQGLDASTQGSIKTWSRLIDLHQKPSIQVSGLTHWVLEIRSPERRTQHLPANLPVVQDSIRHHSMARSTNLNFSKP